MQPLGLFGRVDNPHDLHVLLVKLVATEMDDCGAGGEGGVVANLGECLGGHRVMKAEVSDLHEGGPLLRRGATP